MLWSTEGTLNFYLLLWRKLFHYRGKKADKYENIRNLGRVPKMGESDAFIFRESLTVAFIPLITPVGLMSYFVHFSLCLAFVQIAREGTWWIILLGKNGAVICCVSLDCLGHHADVGFWQMWFFHTFILPNFNFKSIVLKIWWNKNNWKLCVLTNSCFCSFRWRLQWNYLTKLKTAGQSEGNVRSYPCIKEIE